MKHGNYVCKMCGAVDSKCAESRWGTEYCSECHSVEQGFLYVEEFEGFNGLVIDEDGNIYKECQELDGPIANLYDP